MVLTTSEVVSSYETRLTAGELNWLATTVRQQMGNEAFRRSQIRFIVTKEDDFHSNTEKFRVTCTKRDFRAGSVEELVNTIVAIATLES